MFDITFYPATYGDSIWVTYGTPEDPHHILIDGGTAGAREFIAEKLKDLEEDGQHLELMIISHVDRDHVEGILSIFKNYGGVFNTKDCWFNAYKHLVDNSEWEKFGPKQGEMLSSYLEETGTPWNAAFGGGAVVVGDPEKPPTFTLAGGIDITLLSPYPEHLAKLKPVWIKEILDAGLVPGHVPVELPEGGKWERFGAGMPNVEALANAIFEEDTAPANGSSIAVMLEFEGKRVLMAADAHPGTILTSLNAKSQDKIDFDLFKLSHHGSAGNTSTELFIKAPAHHYAISTSGTRWPHPSQETIARLLASTQHTKSLLFNYRSTVNSVWDDLILKDQYKYTTQFGNQQGITISL